MDQSATRFVTSENMVVEHLPWGPHEWLCRPDIVEAKLLQLVRVRIPPGKGHAFHRHPSMEEIIYIESGTAEQWVDQNMQILNAGDSAHIPMDMVHGTYNTTEKELVVLAILSPAKFEGPALVDVSQDEPWVSLRG